MTNLGAGRDTPDAGLEIIMDKADPERIHPESEGSEVTPETATGLEKDLTAEAGAEEEAQSPSKTGAEGREEETRLQVSLLKQCVILNMTRSI